MSFEDGETVVAYEKWIQDHIALWDHHEEDNAQIAKPTPKQLGLPLLAAAKKAMNEILDELLSDTKENPFEPTSKDDRFENVKWVDARRAASCSLEIVLTRTEWGIILKADVDSIVQLVSDRIEFKEKKKGTRLGSITIDQRRLKKS